MARKKRSDPFQDKYPSTKGWVVHYTPVFTYSNLYCCGIKELYGIQNQWIFTNEKTGLVGRETPSPVQQMPFIKDCIERFDPPRAIWIFSDNDKKALPGEELAQYIEYHKLGTVMRSGYHRNPNSGNDIQMYTWIIDNAALKKHKPAV